MTIFLLLLLVVTPFRKYTPKLNYCNQNCNCTLTYSMLYIYSLMTSSTAARHLSSTLPHHLHNRRPPPAIRLLVQPSQMFLQISILNQFTCQHKLIKNVWKYKKVTFFKKEPAAGDIARGVFTSTGMKLKKMPHFLAKRTTARRTNFALSSVSEKSPYLCTVWIRAWCGSTLGCVYQKIKHLS